MEVVQGAHDFAGVEVAGDVVESAHVPQVGEELAARNVLHQHVEKGGVLVGPHPATITQHTSSQTEHHTRRHIQSTIHVITDRALYTS